MERRRLVLVLAVLMAAGGSFATEVPTTVVYQHGLLTVRCRNASAREVLSLVGTLTASVVLIDDSVGARTLTADVIAQPLDRALVQLFEGSGLGYALAYPPRGVARIVVGGQDALPKASRPPRDLLGLDPEAVGSRIQEALSAGESVERPGDGEAQRAVDAALRVLGKEPPGVPGGPTNLRAARFPPTATERGEKRNALNP